MRKLPLAIVLLLVANLARADAPENAGKLPFIEVDVPNSRVRVECEMIGVKDPLEFFCCLAGTNEHESVLRSRVRPRDLHLALLMIGLEPGAPVHYSEEKQQWIPPSGSTIKISVEFERDGKTVTLPATQLMRAIRTKEPMPEATWIFTGSRVLPDGAYAADHTGYLVSIVNFEMTVIDVPQLASNANETLMWETNHDAAPAPGAKVVMIVEPADEVRKKPEARVPFPNRIDMPLLLIDAEGNLELDGRAIALSRIVDELKQARQERPLAVRVVHADGAPRDVRHEVFDALRQAQVRVELVPPDHGRFEP